MPDLSQLSAFLAAEPAALRPLEAWNPPDCGMMDLTIQADGTWIHAGSAITRPPLVKLFASILWHEEGRYFLKTPVEKIGITVEDLPFIAVEMQISRQNGQDQLIFRTNVDDVIIAGEDHPLHFTPQADGQMRPALHVRRNLYARLSRPLYYDLVELGQTRALAGTDWFGVSSGTHFFPMIEADKLELA
jgi:hypothetical protein